MARGSAGLLAASTTRYGPDARIIYCICVQARRYSRAFVRCAKLADENTMLNHAHFAAVLCRASQMCQKSSISEDANAQIHGHHGQNASTVKEQ